MRFLEERLTYSTTNLTRDQLDQEKLERGNEAAHRGNGVADAAVLAIMARNGVDIEAYKCLFEQMYRCPDLDSFQHWPPKIKQIIDLGASVKAGQGIHGGLGTEEQRSAVAVLVNNIINRYISRLITTLEGAEQDPDIETWLAEAEAIKDEVVRTYNQRRSNRRAARNTQQSTTMEVPTLIRRSGQFFDYQYADLDSLEFPAGIGWQRLDHAASEEALAEVRYQPFDETGPRPQSPAQSGSTPLMYTSSAVPAHINADWLPEPQAPVQNAGRELNDTSNSMPTPEQNAEDGWVTVSKKKNRGR